MLASAGDTKLRPRVKEAEEAEGFQAPLRRQRSAMLHRRAGRRMQHVERNRIRFDFPKGKRQIDQILITFSHPDNAA